MMVRVSHEVSHSWFGITIGALDWTEEWLSEVRFEAFSISVFSGANRSVGST